MAPLNHQYFFYSVYVCVLTALVSPV